MPRFRIVVDHEEKAHKAHVASYARGVLKEVAGLPVARQARVISQQMAIAQRRAGKPRPVGTVHDTCDSDCPDGLPNCRNCGDPEYRQQCEAEGHCDLCGTAHGIAPDSVLEANGYKLEAVEE